MSDSETLLLVGYRLVSTGLSPTRSTATYYLPKA